MVKKKKRKRRVLRESIATDGDVNSREEERDEIGAAWNR